MRRSGHEGAHVSDAAPGGHKAWPARNAQCTFASRGCQETQGTEAPSEVQSTWGAGQSFFLVLVHSRGKTVLPFSFHYSNRALLLPRLMQPDKSEEWSATRLELCEISLDRSSAGKSLLKFRC